MIFYIDFWCNFQGTCHPSKMTDLGRLFLSLYIRVSYVNYGGLLPIGYYYSINGEMPLLKPVIQGRRHFTI